MICLLCTSDCPATPSPTPLGPFLHLAETDRGFLMCPGCINSEHVQTAPPALHSTKLTTFAPRT